MKKVIACMMAVLFVTSLLGCMKKYETINYDKRDSDVKEHSEKGFKDLEREEHNHSK